jgi:hypothetical protein
MAIHLEQAKRITKGGLIIYNNKSSHKALNNMMSTEYKTLKQAA